MVPKCLSVLYVLPAWVGWAVCCWKSSDYWTFVGCLGQLLPLVPVFRDFVVRRDVRPCGYLKYLRPRNVCSYQAAKLCIFSHWMRHINHFCCCSLLAMLGLLSVVVSFATCRRHWLRLALLSSGVRDVSPLGDVLWNGSEQNMRPHFYIKGHAFLYC
jgi:hypothetical protein